MTSHSPGISTPVSIPSVRSAAKPTVHSRPPVSWSNNKKRQGLEPSSQGLAAVRESGTSSSSSSTVKASGSRDDPHRIVASRASPMPLSPTNTSPPRQTSRSGTASSNRSNLSMSSPEKTTANLRLYPSPQLGSGQTGRGLSPPPRPSRDGVPTLDVQKIESDLTAPRSTPFTLGRSLSNVSSSSSIPPRLAASPHIIAGRQFNQPPGAPRIETNISAGRTAKEPSPQSASPSKLSSRFHLFSRRTKSPMEPSAAETSARKGPAAGTGHEGYGKYARRGRSGSLSTSASRGRSNSSTSIRRTSSSRKSSITSQNEEHMDEFYRSRLEPKKIVGGGQSVASSTYGSDAYLSEAAQSVVSTSTRGEARQLDLRAPSQNVSIQAKGDPSKPHSLRHIGQRLPHRAGHSGSLQQGEEMAPTLATRRSLHRSQLPLGPEPIKIPAPIDTRATAPSPALNSQNTYQSSIAPSDSSAPITDDISEGREGSWLKPGKKDKPTKSPKKWAFFRRGSASPRKTITPDSARPSLDQTRELRAQVSRMPAQRNLAFYELMNPSEHGDDDDNGLEMAATQRRYLAPQLPVNTQAVAPEEVIVDRQKHSVLLPSPPVLAGGFSEPPQLTKPSPAPEELKTPRETTITSAPSQPEQGIRRPRLQQIGRIPRVVSKRDRTLNPAPQSFSRPRPFVPRPDRTSLPPQSAPVTATSFPMNTEKKPILGIQTMAPNMPKDTQLSAKPFSAPAAPFEDDERPKTRDEFLVFPPRIGSQVSGSSSSGNLSVVDITAIVPHPGAAPTEEEEWNEYNDFLDIMESPPPLVKPNVDPHEKSFKTQIANPAPLNIRKDASSGSSKDSITHVASRVPPPTKKLPSPPRRTQPRAQSPSKELVLKNPTGATLLEPPARRSLVASSRYSTSSIESEADSLSNLENVPPLRVGVPNHLRLELLTISKQLTFDKELFSPAHSEVLGNKRSRILVLDGLGVDDWAFFCAQEYPETQISNLSSTPRSSTSVQNYDHHHYPNLEGPFPFPQNYFTAAVLRFPASSSERAYNNVIREFRRVLAPKGHLEISVLDLDMGKMGNETRRALRGLKERKQIREPQTSLKPLSDTLQKMLGGNAFTNLKQCTLEIPVASIAESTRVRSFNEKMELIDEMPRGDSEQTRHLPEIGRWWYSRCYESGILHPGSSSRQAQKSIWDDRTILEECRSMETGFKMVLCHAQKPDYRRTRSF